MRYPMRYQEGHSSPCGHVCGSVPQRVGRACTWYMCSTHMCARVHALHAHTDRGDSGFHRRCCRMVGIVWPLFLQNWVHERDECESEIVVKSIYQEGLYPFCLDPATPVPHCAEKNELFTGFNL
jgi:hypothetical protein